MDSLFLYFSEKLESLTEIFPYIGQKNDQIILLNVDLFFADKNRLKLSFILGRIIFPLFSLKEVKSIIILFHYLWFQKFSSASPVKIQVIPETGTTIIRHLTLFLQEEC